MLSSSIAWILIVSVAVAAAGGLAACLCPQPVLQFLFKPKITNGLTMLFVRLAALPV
jgi:hypothetical protein